jgi:pantetheine-phosphate adenylyltransferase
MALMNRHLNADMETVFMMPRLDLTYVSSSLVREIARFEGNTGDLVNPLVHQALRERFSRA